MILPKPAELGPDGARVYAVVALVCVVGYVGMLAVLALLYAAVPTGWLGLPAGIICACGARCTQYLLAYRQFARQGMRA